MNLSCSGGPTPSQLFVVTINHFSFGELICKNYSAHASGPVSETDQGFGALSGKRSLHCLQGSVPERIMQIHCFSAPCSHEGRGWVRVDFPSQW